MFTKTTATTGPELTQDSIILNNQEGSGDGIRFQNCLAESKFQFKVLSFKCIFILVNLS